MRRFLTLMITILLSISLAGCGGTSASSTGQAKKDTKPVVVAVQKDTSKSPTVPVQPKPKSTAIPAVKKESTKINEPKKAVITEKKTNTAEKQKTVTTIKPAVKPVVKPNSQTSGTKPVTKTPVQKPISTVTISIVGPKDHRNILAAEKVSFQDGDTIYDILMQAAKKHGIQVDSRGSGATAYVEGIDNIYEFDYGVKSGWIFKQNGSSLTRSVGVMKVKAGDSIQCLYTE